MRIYEADCDAKIIKTVWDYTEAILGLQYSVIWDCAKTNMVLSVTPGHDCTGKRKQ